MHIDEVNKPLLGNGNHDNKGTYSREKEGKKAITNTDQQIIRSSESNKEELPTTSNEDDVAMVVKGIDAKHKHEI